MAAWSAQIGSISVTITLTPCEESDWAEPFPTSPYPATTATFPASIISVARRMASTSDSRQPYFIIKLWFGNRIVHVNGREQKRSLCHALIKPVYASGLFLPKDLLMPAASSGYLSNTILVRSPPSSRIMLKWLAILAKPKVCSMHQSNSSAFIPFGHIPECPLLQ